MRYALLLPCLVGSICLAQATTQPADPFAAAPATAPATQPAQGKRDTPIGMCQTFDATAADIGVEGLMKFYHCTTAAQRRYARAECEFYVSVNKLVREVKNLHGAEAAKRVREFTGDSDDYSDVTVAEEGESAAIQREGQQPIPLIKIDGQWHFSMPDWFEIMGADSLASTRLSFETLADAYEIVTDNIKAGKLKKIDAIEEATARAAQRE
jgi:hypothetical protein